jgi:hypothetical protein
MVRQKAAEGFVVAMWLGARVEIGLRVAAEAAILEMASFYSRNQRNLFI